MGKLPLNFLLSLFWAAQGAVISDKEPSDLDSCRDFGQAFERIFALPGEAAFLNCTLDIKQLFNPENTSYNITWYNKKTGSEVTPLHHSVILQKQSLWFLNITMEHQGSYMCVVRTPDECFTQATVLTVIEMTSESCVRAQRSGQRIDAGVNGLLACPLRAYFRSVDSWSIQWYKNCEKIEEDQKFVPRKDMLFIRNARLDDAGFYTCRMTFSLGGVVGEMAETLECEVHDESLMKPRMVEPVDEILRVHRATPPPIPAPAPPPATPTTSAPDPRFTRQRTSPFTPPDFRTSFPTIHLTPATPPTAVPPPATPPSSTHTSRFTRSLSPFIR